MEIKGPASKLLAFGVSRNGTKSATEFEKLVFCESEGRLAGHHEVIMAGLSERFDPSSDCFITTPELAKLNKYRHTPLLLKYATEPPQFDVNVRHLIFL